MNEGPLRDSVETLDLLERARCADRQAVEDLFVLHRERLRRMVELRIAQPLRRRLDASDVVQEAFLEAAQRLPAYLADNSMPFFLWLRFLTRQKLAGLHRHHLGTRARDPRLEVALLDGTLPEPTTDALAAHLLGQLSSPSQAAVKAEMRLRLEDALNRLAPQEREILALRHFEQLSNAEAACELSIAPSAASKRYIRALTRLKGTLASMKIPFGAGDTG